MDTTDATKPWYLSKGIIGSLLAIVAVIAGFFGVKVDAGTQQVVADQLTTLLAAGAALLGSLLGLWGRVSATRRIG
ncbi:hypothetical protein [Methylobacterium sp. NFXW15]|uniref:hypothetical protein n=1 Tax=Methylobacterium sp. NFXW15 TaxID=2819512 RepID=UPI003CF93B5A